MKPIAALILVLAAILACSTKETQYTALERELNSYFERYFQADEPGASILIVKKGKPVYSKSIGLADLNTKEKISSKTLFNLGSISKTFVAHGILILESEGKLSLNDPLSIYFPRFKNKVLAESITIKHLLTHTSGLPDLRKITEDSVFYLTARDEENWAPIMQADSLVFAPGEQYEYSNPAFNALALIIEQTSGMKWQQFIEQRILKPSGMQTSTITDGPHPASGVSHGYTRVGETWVEDDYGEEPTFAAAGNGGVWSSVEELALYEQAIANTKFLNDDAVNRARTIQDFENWKSDEPPFIGLSWFIDTTPDGLKIVSHTGTQGGFYCHYVTIPEKQLLFIVLANRYYEREECYDKVMELLREEDWLGE